MARSIAGSEVFQGRFGRIAPVYGLGERRRPGLAAAFPLRTLVGAVLLAGTVLGALGHGG